MRYNFIPVNNNIDKAIAFANSLDNKFITNVQKIKQKEFYIPTLDVVETLQNEGWKIKGVDEQRSKSRKIVNNYVQMYHPDFLIKNSKGNDEAVTSITISNSCSGNQPLNLDLGVYREICSNGLMGFTKAAETTKIKHTRINARDLNLFIFDLDNKATKILEEVQKMKCKNLTIDEMRNLAYQAAKLRYNEESENFNFDNLLKVNREEDIENDTWSVFNRIQENLTYNINNKVEDIRLNKQLYNIINREVAYA